MGIVSFDNLKPGMVLRENLFDPQGRLLLQKGSKISAKHLQVFRSRGVLEADVEGQSDAEIKKKAVARIDSGIMGTAEELTRLHFRHTRLDHDATAELFGIASVRRAKAIARGSKRALEPDNVVATPDTSELEHISPGVLVREEDMELPSLPMIYHQIKEVVSRPSSSAQKIAEIIEKDTSLSAKLLKLVNSPFYGLSSQIEDLSRAVTIIGTEQLCTLALGVTVATYFKNIPSKLIDMQHFWQHSVACGICARKLAEYKNIKNRERLFIAGLLHDIGRLIIYQSIPDHGREALLAAQDQSQLLYETEKEVIGFNHADVGNRALKKWAFPPHLISAVRHHHDPRRSEFPLETAIVHVADVITNALRFGSSGERFTPPMAVGIWTSLDLPTHILEPTVKEMENQMAQIIRFLFSEKES